MIVDTRLYTQAPVAINMGKPLRKICHWVQYPGCQVDMETFKAIFRLDNDSDAQG